MKRIEPYCSLFLLFFLFVQCVFFSSCGYYKKIKYFRDINDTAAVTIRQLSDFRAPTIQPDDVLAISIQTVEPGATISINQSNIPVGTANNGAVSQPAPGFLVNKEGEVTLPVVGKINLKDKTSSEARDLIEKEVARYYKNPVVDVRFSNFKITVLGEVNRPSTFIVPNERISVLDALGLAGDLTIYGKRENILLVREEGNVKKFIHLNLNSSLLVTSEYFFLRQNDVLYVEPAKSKIASTDAVRTRNLTIATTLVSLIIVILARVKF